MLRRTLGHRLYGVGEPKKMLKMPGRKCLDDICKLDLFEAARPDQVMNLWNDHHKQFVQYYGRVISTPAYTALRPRLTASPYFVVPIFRDKGLFNVVTNFNDDLVGVVPLQEYQNKGDNANIHMTVQFFTELSQSKQLVLVRCEITDKVMVRQDCMFLTQMLLKYYTMPHLYETYVETFNKRPNQFDYHALLRHMKDEAGKDTIDIKDRKQEMRQDAYSASSLKAAAGVSVPSPTVAAAIQKGHDRAQ